MRHLTLPAITFALLSSATLADSSFVTAKRLLDPARGQFLSDAVVEIEQGRIVRVGQNGEVAIPENAIRVDLGDRTLLPGLIDMHTHLTSSATKARGWQGVGIPTERRVIWGVMHARRTLLAGFTTVRNVGTRGYETVALRDAINAGEVPGPTMFVAGPPVGIIGGHCSDNNLLPWAFMAKGEGVATGPWEMRAKVRKNIKYGVDLIKTCSTGGVFSKGTTLGAPQGTIEELRAIVEEAHMRGLKVAAHAHGTVGIKNAIEAGVDTIEHASFLDEEAIRLAKRKGVFLSMDIYNTEFTLREGERLGVRKEALDKERTVSVEQRESFRRAVQAGVKVLFGSDAAIYPHGDNGKQFARMVRFGMTPIQAIQAATSLAAEALGKQGQLGCIEAGCAADLIAVDSDPLQDIATLENIPFVLKAGVVIKADGVAQFP